MTLQLRPYQEECVNAIETAWASGVQRPLVSMFTGGGKTLVFMEAARRRGRKTLVLAHHEELLHQAQQKCKLVWPGATLGMLKADECELDADVVTASIMSAVKPARMAALREAGFGTIIVDEAHHSVAPTYQWVMDQLGCFSGQSHIPFDKRDLVRALGVTATPARADGQRLGTIWQEAVFQKSLPWAIKAGYASDLRACPLVIGGLELGPIGVREGDFAKHQLFEAVEKSNMAERVGGWFAKGSPEGRKRTLVFCTTIFEAKRTQMALENAGMRAGIVLSGDGPQRRETLAAFSAGDLDVLVNCGVLLEGYDEPAIDCVIVARPTRSQPLYLQMIGRGTRRHPGKLDCLIVDGVSAESSATPYSLSSATPHSSGRLLVCAADLFGLYSSESVWGKAQREGGEADLGESLTPWNSVSPNSVHWVQAGARWIAQDEGQYLVLRPLGVEWEVWSVPKREGQLNTAPRPLRRPQKLQGGLDLGYAQGVVEDMTRGNPIAQGELGWRTAPPSDRQKAAMLKLGIWRDSIRTRGEATDAWAVWEVERAL